MPDVAAYDDSQYGTAKVAPISAHPQIWWNN